MWDWNREPLPDEVNADSLAVLERELQTMLAPASPAQILAELEALRNHYSEWQDRSEGQAKRLHKDYLEDLAELPATLLTEACRRWRRSTATRPPSSGELLEKVKPEIERGRRAGWRAMRAREVLLKGNQP